MRRRSEEGKREEGEAARISRPAKGPLPASGAAARLACALTPPSPYETRTHAHSRKTAHTRTPLRPPTRALPRDPRRAEGPEAGEEGVDAGAAAGDLLDGRLHVDPDPLPVHEDGGPGQALRGRGHEPDAPLVHRPQERLAAAAAAAEEEEEEEEAE